MWIVVCRIRRENIFVKYNGRRQDNIKLDIEDVECGGVNWFQAIRLRCSGKIV
jgi:hypothetical protein